MESPRTGAVRLRVAGYTFSESDLDFLIDFEGDAEWGLLEHIQMQQELRAIFQRGIDLITKRALLRSPNRLLRQEILSTARVLFSRSEGTNASG